MLRREGDNEGRRKKGRIDRGKIPGISDRNFLRKDREIVG